MTDHEFFMNNIDETFMDIYGHLCGLAEMMIFVFDINIILGEKFCSYAGKC